MQNEEEGSTYNIGWCRTREVGVVILPLVVGVEVLALVIGIAVLVRIAHALIGRVHIASVILMVVPLVVLIVIAIAIAIPIAIARAPLVVAVAVAVAIAIAIVVVGTVVSSTPIALVRFGLFGHEIWAVIAVVVGTVVSSTSIALVRSGPIGHKRRVAVVAIHVFGVLYTKAMMGVWNTAAGVSGKALCKWDHSFELPKVGFQLPRCPANLCFWLVFFLWLGLFLLDPFVYQFGYFWFFNLLWCFFGEECLCLLVFAFSWDTSPQEAGDSLQVRQLKTTP